MKKFRFLMTCSLVIFLSACSTNPDGSVNWADNPLNHVATKIDKGIQAANADMDRRLGIKEADGTVTHEQMLKWGYIRRNPDYPHRATQKYVFTSRNCNPKGNTLCFHPSEDVAERP